MKRKERIAIAAMQALIGKLPTLDRLGEHGAKASEEDINEMRRQVAISAVDYADALEAELERRATPFEVVG